MLLTYKPKFGNNEILNLKLIHNYYDTLLISPSTRWDINN